jgi:hypothetical protein
MDNNVNIAEINSNLQESFIHYDPNRVDFTVSYLELELLEQTGNSIWKDVCLASLGLGLPSLINGLGDYFKLPAKGNITPDIFLNLLIAGITILLSLICFKVWHQNKTNFKKLIDQIKNKPKFKIPGPEQ